MYVHVLITLLARGSDAAIHVLKKLPAYNFFDTSFYLEQAFKGNSVLDNVTP